MSAERFTNSWTLFSKNRGRHLLPCFSGHTTFETGEARLTNCSQELCQIVSPHCSLSQEVISDQEDVKRMEDPNTFQAGSYFRHRLRQLSVVSWRSCARLDAATNARHWPVPWRCPSIFSDSFAPIRYLWVSSPLFLATSSTSIANPVLLQQYMQCNNKTQSLSTET